MRNQGSSPQFPELQNNVSYAQAVMRNLQALNLSPQPVQYTVSPQSVQPRFPAQQLTNPNFQSSLVTQTPLRNDMAYQPTLNNPPPVSYSQDLFAGNSYQPIPTQTAQPMALNHNQNSFSRKQPLMNTNQEHVSYYQPFLEQRHAAYHLIQQ